MCELSKCIKHSLIVFLLLLLAGFNFSEVGKEGNSDIVEITKFVELEPHNGFYQRFVGNVKLEADLAVLVNNPKKIYVVISVDHQSYFPFLNPDQLMLIQLIDSEKLLEGLTVDLGNYQEEYVVIGRSKVEFEDFNIGGDCGQPSYFSFKYRLINQTSEVAAYSIAEQGC